MEYRRLLDIENPLSNFGFFPTGQVRCGNGQGMLAGSELGKEQLVVDICRGKL